MPPKTRLRTQCLTDEAAQQTTKDGSPHPQHLLVLRNTTKANPCAPPQIRLRNNTLNKTIAVVLRGEAFRNTGQQHVRRTAAAPAWKTQRRIADDHEKWFKALGRSGYGVRCVCGDAALLGHERDVQRDRNFTDEGRG